MSHQYFLPPQEFKKFFSNKKENISAIEQLSFLNINENFFCLLDKLKINVLYAQGYSAEYLADIYVKNQLPILYSEKKRGQSIPSPLHVPSYARSNDEYPFIQYNNNDSHYEYIFSSSEYEAYNNLVNDFDKYRASLINTIHAFSQSSKNNLLLQTSVDNEGNYQIKNINPYALYSGIHHGLKIESDEPIEELSPFIVKQYFFKKFGLQNKILEQTSLLQSTEFKHEAESHIFSHLMGILSIPQESNILEAIDFLKKVINTNIQHPGSFNQALVSQMTNHIYNTIPQVSEPMTLDNFGEMTLVQPVKQKLFSALSEIINYNSFNVEEFLFNIESSSSIQNPLFTELIHNLHNMSYSFKAGSYNLENIQKNLPSNQKNLLNEIIEKLHFYTSLHSKQDIEFELSSESEDPISHTGLLFIYPFLDRLTQTSLFSAWGKIAQYLAEQYQDQPFSYNDSVHFSNKSTRPVLPYFRQFYTSLWNKENQFILQQAIPFKDISIEEVTPFISKHVNSLDTQFNPHIDSEYPYYLANYAELLLNIANSKIAFKTPQSISQVKKFLLDEHIHIFLKKITECLDGPQASLLSFVNPDIPKFFKPENLIFLHEKLYNLPFDTHKDLGIFRLTDTISKFLNTQLNNNPDLLRSHQLLKKVKELPSYMPFRLDSYGLKSLEPLISNDLSDIQELLLHKDHSDFVLKASIIDKLIEKKSPLLQHPLVQEYFLSPMGFSHITDLYFNTSPKDILNISTDKEKIAQYFMNTEHLYATALVTNPDWISFLPEEYKTNPQFWGQAVLNIDQFFGPSQPDNIFILMKTIPEHIFLQNDFYKNFITFSTENLSDDKHRYFLNNVIKGIPSSTFQNDDNLIASFELFEKLLHQEKISESFHYNLLRTVLIKADPSFETLPTFSNSSNNNREETYRNLISYLDDYIMRVSVNTEAAPASKKQLKF